MIDHPVVTPDEVRTRREASASTLKLLKSQEEMVPGGYRPGDAVQDDVQQAYFWVNDVKMRFSTQQAKLDTVVAKAPPVADLATALPLEEAIRNHRTRMMQMSAQAQVEGQDVAKDSTRQILVDASVMAELQRARDEAARVLVGVKNESERQKLESDTRIAELQKTIDNERARMRMEEADRAAEIERREKAAEADRYAQNVDARLKREGKVSVADKKLLEQKCRSPEVLQKLGPFLGKGWARPCERGMNVRGNYDSVEPVSVSLADLQQTGALNKTGNGCDVLYGIASTPLDQLRPRWPSHRGGWRSDAATSKLVPEAQALLIELGPTLVELGMLQP